MKISPAFYDSQRERYYLLQEDSGMWRSFWKTIAGKPHEVRCLKPRGSKEAAAASLTAYCRRKGWGKIDDCKACGEPSPAARYNNGYCVGCR